MSTHAIYIRARTPPRSRPPDQESHHVARHRGLGSGRWEKSNQYESSGWDASTGSVQARNLQRLSRTRFVKEGEKSRPWTGNWVEPSEKSVAKSQKSDENEAQDNSLDHEASQPFRANVVSASDTQVTGTMASFYAQLAASLKAPSVVSASSTRASSNAPVASGSAGMRPRSVAHRSRSEAQGRSKGSTTDWFSDRPRVPTASVRLGRVKASASRPKPQQHPQQEPATASATLIPCPTCSAPLPYPCPPGMLRSHLSSIAHRLALPHLPPAPSPSTTPISTAGEQKLELKLHLDEANRGYRLLSGMGWREGMGVGRSEWEWEEGQRERERSRAAQEAARRTKEVEKRKAIKLEVDVEGEALQGEVLTVSSDEDEDDEADGDGFGALAHLDSAAGDGIDDVFRLPPPSPPREQRSQPGAPEAGEEAQNTPVAPTAKRPEPRLVPISISQKHDRAGLGRKLRPSSSSSSTLAGSKKRKGGTGGAEALFTLRKRERELRDRQEREERLAIRDTLR